jgi:hypothetical protein
VAILDKTHGQPCLFHGFAGGHLNGIDGVDNLVGSCVMFKECRFSQYLATSFHSANIPYRIFF